MAPTSRAIRDDHVGSTWLRVIWVESFVVDGRNRYRIYAVRVAIKVALVTVRSAVPTRKHEDGAFPTSPIVDTIDDCFFNQVIGTLHGLAVIRGTPAAAVNRNVLKAIVECSSFIHVGYGTR